VERDDGVGSSSGWFKGSSRWEKAEGGGDLVLSVAERKGKAEREEEEQGERSCGERLVEIGEGEETHGSKLRGGMVATCRVREKKAKLFRVFFIV